MKINVAVHIPLFNILSVRQTYCLSIGEGGGKSLSVSPRSLWETHGMAGVAFTRLRMRAARSAFFAYMLDKSESRPSISFINFHSDVAGLCDWRLRVQASKWKPYIYLEFKLPHSKILIQFKPDCDRLRRWLFRLRINPRPCNFPRIP